MQKTPDHPTTLPASIWGHHFWFFLHTIAMHYPLHPNENTKKQYYELIVNLPLFLPIGKSYFSTLLELYPVAPYLTNRHSLTRWMHFIHNKMNIHLEKPILSFDQHWDNYWKSSLAANYQPTEKQWNMYKKNAIRVAMFAGAVGVAAWTFT